MTDSPKQLLIDLLKATSRSFYLIPHCGTRLPARVRPQTSLVKRIGLAREGGLNF